MSVLLIECLYVATWMIDSNLDILNDDLHNWYVDRDVIVRVEMTSWSPLYAWALYWGNDVTLDAFIDLVGSCSMWLMHARGIEILVSDLGITEF